MIRFFQSCARGLRACGLFALASSLAVSQSVSASLSGVVRDYSGARISGVAIAVIAADGKVKFTVSDRDGRYLIADLQPGTYNVWAWSKGFALYEDSSVLVRSGRDATLDIPLEVGVQQPRVPGRELLRTSYDPARNLRRAVKSDGDPPQAGMVMTGISTCFRLSAGSDSVGENSGKGVCP